MPACIVFVLVFFERAVKWRRIKYESLQFVQHYFYSFGISESIVSNYSLKFYRMIKNNVLYWL